MIEQSKAIKAIKLRPQANLLEQVWYTSTHCHKNWQAQVDTIEQLASELST